MSNNSRPIALDATGHLPPALLRQYGEDALPPALRHQVERHLLDCPLCADVAEGMALADPAQTQAAVQDLRQRVSGSIRRQQPASRKSVGRGDWRAAAAIVVLLVSAVLVLYDQLSKVKTADVAAAPVYEEAGPAPAPPVIRPAEPMAGTAASPSAADPTVAAAPEAAEPVGRRLPQASVPIARADQEEKGAKDLIAASSPAPATVTLPQQEVLSSVDVPLDQQPVMKNQVKLEEAVQGRVAGVATAPGSGTHLVSGRVQSVTGQALPGVTVIVKNTAIGTTTDPEGKYTLQVPTQQETLVFNYLGFEAAERTLAKGATAVDVQLAEDSKGLSEVVVTGYGVQKRTAAKEPLQAAQPTLGLDAYRQYLQQNLRHPAEARQARGRVVVGFTVSPSGELEGLQVLRGLCPACDAEALRLVKEGPAWQPATREGQPVADQVRVTVRFRP
jgi:TonB family protein